MPKHSYDPIPSSVPDPKPQEKPVQEPSPTEDVKIPDHFRARKITFKITFNSGRTCTISAYSKAEAIRQAELDNPGETVAKVE